MKTWNDYKEHVRTVDPEIRKSKKNNLGNSQHSFFIACQLCS